MRSWWCCCRSEIAIIFILSLEKMRFSVYNGLAASKILTMVKTALNIRVFFSTSNSSLSWKESFVILVKESICIFYKDLFAIRWRAKLISLKWKAILSKMTTSNRTICLINIIKELSICFCPINILLSHINLIIRMWLHRQYMSIDTRIIYIC